MLNNYINKLLINYKRILDKDEFEYLLSSIKYIYKDYVFKYDEKENINLELFLEQTANLNEKTKNRKSFGVYYTPIDVCQFIIKNVVGDRYVLNSKVLDPTCGNSEFLIEYFKYNSKYLVSDLDIIEFTRNIFGNDINKLAILISKIRLLFVIFEKLSNKKNIEIICIILNKNFYMVDAVTNLSSINKKFDYIIGNPPYIESISYEYKDYIQENFGNIYANILKNSINLLKSHGVIGFVIPISYISTPRMKKIRHYVTNSTKYQILFNFSDRPDSLFMSVHQKLTVIIAKKELNSIENSVYTSSYQYWYKKNRENMFNNITLIGTEKFDDFIPKIGNIIEKNILHKVLNKKGDNSLFDILKPVKQNANIYLNMRATFWIKCFINENKGNEYKKYFTELNNKYIFCLLNSSLFFVYWVIISDCWHITNKELKYFKVLYNENLMDKFDILANKLMCKLESTKKYIGSKQVDYEYKHKYCKDIIDDIDDLLAFVYELSKDELEYIKNFNNNYRLSKGE